MPFGHSLTDVWDLSVTQAAGIFNLYYGIINIMPLFTQHIVDAFLGNYRMLMISSTYAFVAVSFFHSSSIPLWYLGQILVAFIYTSPAIWIDVIYFILQTEFYITKKITIPS